MKPSEAFLLHREEIRQIVEQNGAGSPRVFGSVARGDDTDGSDLDLLVEPLSGKTTLLTLVRIKREIEKLLGCSVDVLTPDSLRDPVRQSALKDAIPV